MPKGNSLDPDQITVCLSLHYFPLGEHLLDNIKEESSGLIFKLLVVESGIKRSDHQVKNKFLCSTQLSMKFSLLINIIMPTIVGIFIYIRRENFMLLYV